MSEPAVQSSELRRDVTVWGSFMWGFADVGADIYAALGLVIAATMGAAPLAFAAAGLVYIMIGLAYTELASTYPVAGGGQYYVRRGLGDIAGFIAGSALLLDYTIDIALFAVFSAGYVNFFFPAIRNFKVTLGPFAGIAPLWAAESFVLILLLMWLNVRGVRESSLLNELIGAFGLVVEAGLIVIGLVFAWNPALLADQWLHQFPTLNQFMYGSSLAIISYVGLESISQAAQETRRPATVIPRTSIGLILSVLLFALSFSILAAGMFHLGPGVKNGFYGHSGDPVAWIAQHIPVIGVVAAPLTALIGGVIVFISANSEVVSASRLTYSMSQFKLLPLWFNKVSKKYSTPTRTIVVFSGVAIIQTLIAFFTPGGSATSNGAIELLTDLYAFGATTGYLIVFVSLITLRFKDPYTPRPYHMPLNFPLTYRGSIIQFPVLGVFGLVGVAITWFEVILTHPLGRIAGPAWVVLCGLLYMLYRRRQSLPAAGNVPRDWEAAQKRVLQEAEEYESLEAIEAALAERDGVLAAQP